MDCWISLTWTDNWGPSNEIVSVSGGWNANGRTLSNQQVWYGIVQYNGAFVDNMYETQFPSDDTFYYTPSTSLVGFSLRAYSWVFSEGYSGGILCGVWPTIFD